MVRAARPRNARAGLLMVDIAIPRDIEPGVAALPGVSVIDLDDLADLIESNKNRRMDAAGQVEADVDERTSDFLSWVSGHRSGETIRDLYAQADQIRFDQLERALRRMPNLDERARERLEIFSLQLVNALLHQPVSQVWDWEHGAGNAEALRRIFGLDAAVDEQTSEDRTPKVHPAA
jgi:glutamyl-tRNA reductase